MRRFSPGSRPETKPPVPGEARRAAAAARSEAAQRRARGLIVGGFVGALGGGALYVAASLGSGAGLDAVLLHGVVPPARLAFVAIGAGVLLWLVGAIMFYRAAIAADVLSMAPREDD